MRPLVSQESKAGATQTRPGSTPETESGLSISDILRMITRHWLFIVVCLVVCVGLAYFYAKSLTPIYESSASLRLDPNRAGSLGLNSIVGAGGGGDELSTEIAIIESDSVATETLAMLSDADFRKFAGGPRSQLGIPTNALKLTPAQEGVLAAMKSGLKAHQVGNTQLLAVSFRGPDPQLAATIVNDAVNAYLKQGFDSRYGSVAQVRKWLEGELGTLQGQAASAQNRLTQFQEENNILVTSETSNSTLDELKALSDDLTRAKADRLVKEVQLHAAMSGDPQVISSIFPSPSFSVLQGERASAVTQYAQLASKFADNYPPLIEAKRQVQKLDLQFNGEIALIKARVKQEYDTSEATERVIQQQYDAQLGKAYALNRQEATYGVLLSEVKSSRELYDSLEHNLQQAGVTAGLSAVNTMLLDRARAPLFPVEPKKTVIVGFGFMLGLFAGLGAAFLKEAITDTVQSEEQLEHALRVPVLSIVPHISGAQKMESTANEAGVGRASPMLVSYYSPLSRSSEAYRNLRNGVLLANDQVKTLLVTSTIAGEGKSNTIANFAVVLAQYGAKVLIVDADLRRPRVHTIFGLDNVQGLSNMILGEDIPEPMHQPLPEQPNVYVMTAGKRTTLPSEALSSNRLYSLLSEWEKRFDYVIVDSAPLLVVSDSMPLASWVDATLLVIRYNWTPVAALRRVRTVLGHAQTQIAGVVLNDMPVKSAGYGGYGYRNGDGYYE